MDFDTHGWSLARKGRMLRMKANHYAMKKIFVLVVSIAFLSACSSLTVEDKADFTLEIHYSEEESSEDSNGVSTDIFISDNELTYDWEYNGYHPNEDFVTNINKSIILTPEELTELKLTIEAAELWDEVIEDQINNEMGDSIDLSFSINEAERSVNSEISGMTWSLETKDGNIDNLDYLDSVEDVIYLIEYLLDE
jgi:hypothetical protein